MASEPLTREEIDQIEAGANGAEWVCRLVATARLAPQWKRGTEPPEHNGDVWTIRPYSSGTMRYEPTQREWRRFGLSQSPPALWCELPTPPPPG